MSRLEEFLRQVMPNEQRSYLKTVRERDRDIACLVALLREAIKQREHWRLEWMDQVFGDHRSEMSGCDDRELEHICKEHLTTGNLTS